jgi:cation transport ATPase
VLRDGQIVYVSTPTILPGEIVLIRPGSRIPVDGQVVSAVVRGRGGHYGQTDARTA